MRSDSAIDEQPLIVIHKSPKGNEAVGAGKDLLVLVLVWVERLTKVPRTLKSYILKTFQLLVFSMGPKRGMIAFSCLFSSVHGAWKFLAWKSLRHDGNNTERFIWTGGHGRDSSGAHSEASGVLAAAAVLGGADIEVKRSSCWLVVVTDRADASTTTSSVKQTGYQIMEDNYTTIEQSLFQCRM